MSRVMLHETGPLDASESLNRRPEAQPAGDAAAAGALLCFHCGEPVPAGLGLSVRIDGADRPMCCRGCQAVAQSIVDYGLGDYYRYRTQTPASGQELVPEVLREAAAYDHPQLQQRFVRSAGAGEREAALILEGVVCPACAWLNESCLQALPGVIDAQVNYTNNRVRVRWDEARTSLGQILAAVARIGYRAHPYDPARQQSLLEQERRYYLRRLTVAGLLGMQVMMIALAVYFGDWWGMEPPFRHFFDWVNLLLAAPVLGFCAQPFFRGAWRDLKRLRTGMDVPVALAILGAYAGSAWATVRGEGHVYYDSVVMFTFLLLLARYLELMARKRATDLADDMVRALPAMATRLRDGGAGEQEETVPVIELAPADIVLVRPGEYIPADGRVLSGCSGVDESLLTGESKPLTKAAGAPVIGGSLNIDSPLRVSVEHVGEDTVLSQVLRLLDRAQADKPAITRLADRAAAWFVAGVLLLALGVAAYWAVHDPQAWFPITLSVLVVSCPCALSLAAPAAVTAATGRLVSEGLLATRGQALETLARTTHFVFDKTGTLTAGRLRLSGVQTFGPLAADACLRITAALERGSEHPIARALLTAHAGEPPAAAEELRNEAGQGLQGRVAGTLYYLGTPDFVRASTGLEWPAQDAAGEDSTTLVVLASAESVLAAFSLEDEVRPGAAELIAGLRAAGKKVLLMTGDRFAAARRLARRVGIEDISAGLQPADKLRAVRGLQQHGAVVAMVGDGINDAPVLAGADVSIAMGGGTQLARTSADLVLLNEELGTLQRGVVVAGRTLRIVRENIAWAIGYNVLVLPAAALGMVPPWAAAIGMSLSSLLVTANALRLARRRRAA